MKLRKIQKRFGNEQAGGLRLTKRGGVRRYLEGMKMKSFHSFLSEEREFYISRGTRVNKDKTRKGCRMGFDGKENSNIIY